MNVVVRDYRHEDPRDAERVAAMFNDFDSAWPGGFTRGSVETPERTREHLAKRRSIAILVAEDLESGDFVGFCDLDAQPGQKDTSYVGLLGARLSVHGKGVGKALIREAVRRAAEAQYREVTLYTWAGNTKAVPLYKKTGFNWVPDTDVYMRNFIPSVLATPIVRAFLGENDWYALHDRVLTVAPDDITWKGMKVFNYRFRNGNDCLQLTYQTDSVGLTAIETPDYSVSCTVPVEEAAAGQSYPVVWEIEPRQGRSLECALLASADVGLEIAVQESFTVRQAVKIARTLHVLPSATPRRQGERTHLVRSTLLIDGQPLTLETGVKVVRPIEVQYSGQAVFAGREEKIAVGLRNLLHTPLTGTLAFDAHGAIACAHPAQPFHLPARSWTQCEFLVTATEPGSHATYVRLQAQADNAADTLETERPGAGTAQESSRSSQVAESLSPSPRANAPVSGAWPVTFRAFQGGEAIASVDAEVEEKAILESPDLRIEVSLRGGEAKLWRNGEKADFAAMGAQIGPPFGSTRMRPPVCAASVDTTGQSARLRIAIPSLQTPGLTLERTFSVLAGSVVQIDQRVVNTTDRPLAAQVRLRTGSQPNGYLAIPTPQGVMREPIHGQGEYPSGDADILAPGTKMAEGWAAAEGDGAVFGLIWQGEPEQDFEWNWIPNLLYDLGEIPPHSAAAVPAYWIIAATGDWQVVRGWWKRLAQPSGVYESGKIEPLRVLSLAADPGPLLLRGEKENITLVLENRRDTAVTGTLRIPGDRFHASPDIISLEKVDRNRPLRAEVTVCGPDSPGAGFLNAEIDTGVLLESRKLPAVRLSAGDRLDVSQPEDGLVVIDNGVLTLRFAPGFFGALTALEAGGVNQLLSAWPEPRPFMWANPWFGGVHPCSEWMGSPDFARETFAGEPVELTGERGWRWRGLRSACDLAHKRRSWLRVELEYLTLPGSNVLALVLRTTNRTDARMSQYAGVACWAQPGGSRDNTILHWERHGERRTRRRGGFAADGQSGKWAAVENADTKDALILIAADPSHSASWEDFGAEGVHLQARGPMEMGPNETVERLYWLVHCTDMSQAAAYAAALSEARQLP